MNVKGQRIHIAGSANYDQACESYEYAHDLIQHLVKELATLEATFSVAVGKNPLAKCGVQSFPIIFDWTVLSALSDCLADNTINPSVLDEKIIFTIATDKTDRQIPKDHYEIWQQLNECQAINLRHTETGWHSGYLRRELFVQ